MRIGVVIPTMGTSAVLPSLLADLNRALPGCRVAVCDQSTGENVQDWVDAARAEGLDVRHVDDRGHRGASRARNLGARAVAAESDLLLFLDDDLTVTANGLTPAVEAFADQALGAVTGRVHSQIVRTPFGGGPVDLDRRTVWSHAMEAALVVRSGLFLAVGGFDEQLGVGAATRFQSGEGTDLLLRIMKAGHVCRYLPVFEVTELSPQPAGRDLQNKAYRYALGTGRVYAKHYSLAGRGRALVPEFRS